MSLKRCMRDFELVLFYWCFVRERICTWMNLFSKRNVPVPSSGRILFTAVSYLQHWSCHVDEFVFVSPRFGAERQGILDLICWPTERGYKILCLVGQNIERQLYSRYSIIICGENAYNTYRKYKKKHKTVGMNDRIEWIF